MSRLLSHIRNFMIGNHEIDKSNVMGYELHVLITCTDAQPDLHVNGKQLRSCWDGQLLNHTVPGQASRRQFTSIKVPILSPVTDN